MQHKVIFIYLLDCETHECKTAYQSQQKAIELVNAGAIEPESVFPARDKKPKGFLRAALEQFFGR